MQEQKLIEQLFTLDRKLTELRSELKVLKDSHEPERLEQQLNNLEKTIENQEESLTEKRRLMKTRELESEQYHQEKKQLEDEMYSGKVTASKELNDLSEKIKDLHQKEQQSFEGYCELTEEIDNEEKNLEQNQNKFQDIKKELDKKSNEIADNKVDVTEKIEELKSKREELKQQMPERLLTKYNSLVNKFPRDAVVKLFEQEVTCACGLELSTERYSRLQVEGMVSCDSCDRIVILTK
ncbi:zinc ribbon domain-containing protein [Natranaerobius thermophilus]|uniref:CT398-like coiled coil hairpin domain-containing protein n=1 Tax=Natranaerobius thermophilus (strain ATCC BAA-1301 / DSM 18059 / JW/NM-WN-LF) TaxID=457570 RepID=B2A1Z6_NATTJ|nr:hypothetical protein [Natranaerobius thermophilus]ACB84801.1 protein of unknown function DUF164 [Natranaerobius thermophilus JW/NM-WN-LF]